MRPWHVAVSAPGATAAAVSARIPPLAKRPLLLVRTQSGTAKVVYTSRIAVEKGVEPGMALNTALGLCPSANAMPCPPEAILAPTQLLSRELGCVATTMESDEFLLSFSNDAPPDQLVSKTNLWFSRVLKIKCAARASTIPLAARVAVISRCYEPTVVHPGREAECLASVPLNRLAWLSLHGVTAMARQWSVFTIGDLTLTPGKLVRKLLGRKGLALQALGKAVPREEESIAMARVALSTPTNKKRLARNAVLQATDQAWRHMLSMGTAAARLELGVCTADGRTRRSSSILDPEREDPLSLGMVATSLFPKLITRRAVCAVEVKLWPGAAFDKQLSLFPELPIFKLGRLGAAMAEVTSRYGPDAITRACGMRDWEIGGLGESNIQHPSSSLDYAVTSRTFNIER